MNLRTELLKEHSVIQAIRISSWAVQNKEHLKELMEIFFSTEPRIAQRAAWAASKAYELKPEWFSVYILKLIRISGKPVHDGIRRNSLRILQSMDIPKKYEGEMLDIAFQMLADPKAAIAIKAFAMTIAFNLVKTYPELKSELKILIEDQLPYATAAIKSRANKILKKL
ncbi:MAG: hypothetical protein H7259_03180 [Cytophagales bacterium]|nr:hypothetical protein [Cytophaga sp.]